LIDFQSEEHEVTKLKKSGGEEEEEQQQQEKKQRKTWEGAV
jgi:hypothetical protein